MLPAWTVGTRSLVTATTSETRPVVYGADDDDPGLDAVAVGIGQLPQLVLAEAACGLRDELAARELRLLDGRRLSPAGCARLRPSAC